MVPALETTGCYLRDGKDMVMDMFTFLKIKLALKKSELMLFDTVSRRDEIKMLKTALYGELVNRPTNKTLR